MGMFNILIVIALFFGIPIALKKMKQRKIRELGRERYDELKNNFDARRIMGELNYMIDSIYEYWEQNEYLKGNHQPSTFKETSQKSKLIKITKKTLDDYIKKEWNPRIKILGENSMNYYSDKELRDAYTQFINADKEIQKLTIEGEKQQISNQQLKVAGIALVAITGLALGAVGAANRAADRQSFRDHFGA